MMKILMGLLLVLSMMPGSAPVLSALTNASARATSWIPWNPEGLREILDRIRGDGAVPFWVPPFANRGASDGGHA